MPKTDKLMLAEHVLEVRHAASGTFLDVKGRIADFVRTQDLFPHWQIDQTVINFKDKPSKIERDGAFVGYKSIGYVVFDPQTRNYFVDRASAFWKRIQSNDVYPIPSPTRFGTRTKVFVPSELTFDQINKRMFEDTFSEKGRGILGGSETDLQFTILFEEAGFSGRTTAGPIHKNEAPALFQFQSAHLSKCGLFLDIDLYKTEDVTTAGVPKLLQDGVGLMWKIAERIAAGFGL